MYYGVLKIELSGNARIDGFADDKALVITNPEEISLVAKASIAEVRL